MLSVFTRRKRQADFIADTILLAAIYAKVIWDKNGNPNTNMAAWVSILSVLDLLDNFKDICDLKNDEMGIILEDEELPKRVRYKKVNYE